MTMVWLPALIAAEVLRPRLSYNVRRWSTVFPVGMYAACSFIVGTLTQTPGISDFARVWVWVSLVVWVIVFAAMVRRTPGLFVANGDASADTRTGSRVPTRSTGT